MKKGKANIQFQGVGFALTITGLLKVLWNKVFPELFGWKKITYWQSVMLYLICKALFDFRYNIKDSFNFGNNNINGDGVSKKKGEKVTDEPAGKAADEPIEKEETPIDEASDQADTEIKIEVEDAEIEELEEVEEEKEVADKQKEDEVIEFVKKEKKGK